MNGDAFPSRFKVSSKRKKAVGKGVLSTFTAAEEIKFSSVSEASLKAGEAVKIFKKHGDKGTFQK